MKRRARLLRLALGLVLVAGGGIVAARFRPIERRVVLPDACHTPARVLEPAPNASGGTVVMFHGLSASAAVMEPIGQSLAEAGWRVYLLDLPGHGRSRERFSYANAETCAAAALDSLARTGAIHPQETILLGHSLGAAIAVRLADRFPFAATIAISPALLALPPPVPIPPRREEGRAPPNLLVLTGQFDFGAVKQTAKALARLAGGMREGAKDFSRRRAVDLREIGGATHGGMILDPRVWKLAGDWSARARAALGPVAQASSLGAPPAVEGKPSAKPLVALLTTFAMLAGMVLLVAPAETMLGRACGVQPASGQPGGMGWKTAIVFWVVASFFAVSLLGLAHAPQWVRPVRMEGGDWAALVALVTGLVLLALGRERLGAAFRAQPRALLFAALAGVAVVAAFAAALNPELVETAANGPRLWRFAVLVAFTWPYFAAEEAMLGAPGGRRRLALFLVLRGVVWLAEAFALVMFWPWGLLMVLLVAQLAIVAIGQRLAADALRRRGAGVPAAALFDAILAAGMLALILPLT